MHYYRRVLQSELEKRCKKNPRYSLRSFAKAMQVDVALLSRVLGNKASLSLNLSNQVSDKLKLTQRQKQMFVKSILEEKSEKHGIHIRPNKLKKISQKDFSSISNWYHYAILEFSQLDNVELSPQTIAKQFGIGITEAKLALNRLVSLNLLVERDGKLVKNCDELTTTDRSQTSDDLRQYHDQILKLASSSVKNDEFKHRSAFGITMAIDPEQLGIARAMMEEFANKLCATLESGKRKQVYHFESVLFPLQKEELI